MTMTEKKFASIQKEIEKLNSRREKVIARVEKKFAIAQKVGAGWTRDEWFEHRDSATEEQANAWFDYSVAQSDLDDIEHRLANAENRSTKQETAVRFIIDKRTKEEIEKEIAEEIARWAEVGITVEKLGGSMVYGTTPNGKRFYFEGNNGMTDRSRHCYTLTIDGQTIFTSGDYYTCFQAIKHA